MSEILSNRFWSLRIVIDGVCWPSIDKCFEDSGGSIQKLGINVLWPEGFNPTIPREFACQALPTSGNSNNSTGAPSRAELFWLPQSILSSPDLPLGVCALSLRERCVQASRRNFSRLFGSSYPANRKPKGILSRPQQFDCEIPEWEQQT